MIDRSFARFYDEARSGWARTGHRLVYIPSEDERQAELERELALYYYRDERGNSYMRRVVRWCPRCGATVSAPVISAYQHEEYCHRHGPEIVRLELLGVVPPVEEKAP